MVQALNPVYTPKKPREARVRNIFNKRPVSLGRTQYLINTWSVFNSEKKRSETELKTWRVGLWPKQSVPGGGGASPFVRLCLHSLSMNSNLRFCVWLRKTIHNLLLTIVIMMLHYICTEFERKFWPCQSFKSSIFQAFLGAAAFLVLAAFLATFLVAFAAVLVAWK